MTKFGILTFFYSEVLKYLQLANNIGKSLFSVTLEFFLK